MISAESFAAIIKRQRKMNENFIDGAGSTIISSVTSSSLQLNTDGQDAITFCAKKYTPRVFLFGSTVSCTALFDGDTDYAVLFAHADLETKSSGEKSLKETCSRDEIHSYMLLLTRKAQIEFLNKLYCLLVFAVGLREDNAVKNLATGEIQKSDSKENANTELLDDFQKSSLHFQRIFCARVPLIQFYPGYDSKVAEAPHEVNTPEESVEEPIDDAHSTEEHEQNPESAFKTPFAPVVPRKVIFAPKPRIYLKSVPSVMLDYKFDMTLSPYGVLNSVLLRYYVLAFPCLRPLLLVIKHWGKRQGIINSRGGWLSSYALSIMLIEYLQTKGKVGFIDPFSKTLLDSIRRKTEKSSQKSDQCTCPFCDVECYIPYHEAEIDAECGALLEGFFRYYAYDVDFEDHVIDITRRCGYDDSHRSEIGKNSFACHPSVEGSCIQRIVSHHGIPLPKRHEKGKVETFFTDSEEKSIQSQFEREAQQSYQSFNARQGAQSGDYRWHYLGYNLFQIKDPYEMHSLGRSVEFFKAEALKELFEIFHKQCASAEDAVQSTWTAERVLSRGMFG